MDEVVRLLVVDDDEAIRSFFAEIFAEEDYWIESAADGEEAMRRIAANSYDVVVTDLCMPRMDGLRLIREIQKVRAGTTVLAITGYGTIKDTVSLMKNGAFDVLSKPFSLDEIRLTVEKAVRHHRLARKNRELEHRLKAAEKLAVIGKLAAGVAHEINSPLDGVIRFINLSLQELRQDPDRVGEYLTDARTGLDRIASIVRSLLDFSRSIACEREPQPLGDLIREAVDQLRHRTDPPAVKVDYRLADRGVTVSGGYLHVFTNMVKNAIDEMPGGGRLVIGSRPVVGGVEVFFTDDGPGIPEALRERVFEPFFTTKEPGRGTGLGLSICQQIVERLGGRISLSSEVGVGTTFTVWIPVAVAPPPATGSPAGTTTRVERRRATRVRRPEARRTG